MDNGKEKGEGASGMVDETDWPGSVSIAAADRPGRTGGAAGRSSSNRVNR